MDEIDRRLRRDVLQTRVLVAAAVLALVALTDASDLPGVLTIFIAAYALVAWGLWEFSFRVVRWRLVRAAPLLLDVIGISVVVWTTGGIESPWFLLYLFPILAIALYLGERRSLQLAVFAIVGYGVACYVAAGTLQPVDTFALHTIVLAAVAFTAGRPERARRVADERLRSAIREIDHAILSNEDIKPVIHAILDAAVEITQSEFSAIRLADGTEATAARVDQDNQRDDIVAVAKILKQHYSSVIISNEPIKLPRDRAAKLSLRRGNGSEGWTARIVPLAIGDSPLGVLGVFTRRRLQYTHDDARRLSSLAHQIAISQKNAALYADSRRSLRMLYEVGEKLKSDQSLDWLFENMLKLVSDQLGSEEAALFLPSGSGSLDPQKGRGTLRKVAVAGPTQAVEERLRDQEEFYEGQDNLIGRVFYSKRSIRDNNGPDEPHGTGYSVVLPSRVIRHYLMAPLLIGDEVLGVLRVLNKKAGDYRPEAGAARLSEGGFREDDLELLSAIATQVASAIRNARFVEQHAHFKKLVYNSPDPIIVADGSGNVQNFNRAAENLWGLKEDAVWGTHIAELYKSPEHAREIGDEVWTAAKLGEGIQDRSAWIRKPGASGDEIIPVRLSAAGLFDKVHRRIGSIGIFADEREEMRRREEQIKNEQLAALGRLAHAKGHDIKHDFGTILNWLDLLRDGAGNDPETLEVCSAIETAASRAIGKLQDMLMAADPKPPVMELVSLRTMLTTFQAGFVREANATHIDFRLRYPGGDHLLLADVEQMRQIFTNLFGNSLDAIKSARELYPNRRSGSIEMDVTTREAYVLLSWSDDGSGMSEEAASKAFTPFFTTKKTGSGLGLFIVKKIVENHDGQIGMEPLREGGLRLTIQLPFTCVVGAADVAATAETPVGGSTR